MALGIGEARVKQGHLVAEAGPEPAGKLGGEGNLRDQHQGTAAAGKRPGDELQVDLGLAGAGDAMEEEGLKAAAERLLQGVDGGALGGGERGRGRAGGQQASAGHGGFGLEEDELALGEGEQGGPSVGEGGLELVDRDSASGEEVVEHGALGPCAGEGLQGFLGLRCGGRELHPAAGGSHVPLAGVEARRQGGAKQFPGGTR